jgi:gliding motility-associated-like protein
MRKIITLIIAIVYSTFLLAQHSDCANAIGVCQYNYVIATPQGVGSLPNELSAGSCLGSENNSTWFVISSQTAGTLSFVITPNSPTEDFNWAVYNISNANCSDIATNPALEIVCNNSSDLIGANPNGPSAGETGAFTNSPWFGGIFPFFPAFESDINVQSGGTYLLYIKNTTPNGQGSGYSIDFSNSSATLFNSSQPALNSVSVPNCGANTVNITFNKPILCNSVSPSDFSILTNSGTLIPTAVSSPNCVGTGNGATASNFTLTFPTTFLSNNYIFQLIGTVSDACGNVLNTASVPFSIPTLPVNAGNNISVCSGQAINQNIGMTGFFPNQTFQWTAQPASYLSYLSSTTSAAANLNIAQMPIQTVLYILTTTSANGCTASDTMVVYGNDCCTNFDVSINSFTNVGCHGAATGVATATVTGGLSPIINYQWNTFPSQTTSTATSLQANQTYIVTATDGNQCQDTAHVYLIEPAQAVSVATTGSNVTCFGESNGSINLTVNGGTQPYTYLWSNNATTQDLTNIAAGTYSVTVADVNNCTITALRTINQPSTALSAIATGSTINCTQSVGTVSLNVSGGSSPYTVVWSNNLGTALSVNGLIPGDYYATITDNNGCQIIKKATVNSTTNISTSVNTTPATCNSVANGTINLTVSGGQAPYTFNWDNGAGTTQNPTGLLPNTYSVTITDANGCLSTTSATVISNGSSMTATAIPTDVSCFNGNDGSIILTINGGQSPFSINWNNGLGTVQNPTNVSANTYTATVTDGIGCTDTAQVIVQQPNDIIINNNVVNVSCFGGNDGKIQLFLSGGTAPFTATWQGLAGNGLIQNGLTAGNYTVTVTDANGCQKSKTINVAQSNVLNINLIPTATSCFNAQNGSIQTIITGGTSPYDFEWSNNVTTQNLTNIAAGTYTVTVTDSKGCVKTKSIIVNQPNAIGGTAVPTNVSCAGGSNGSINLTPTGGTSPYTYAWSNGATSQDLTGLSPANYAVTITDANGCTGMLTATISASGTLIATAIPTDVSCFNANDGSIILNINGGQSPYAINWNNGLGSVQNPTNIDGNTYTATVTDALGCTTTAQAIVNEPTDMIINQTKTNVTCNGGNDGNIQLAILGGNAPYTAVWQGLTSNSLIQNNLIAGNYFVTITDANGCQKTKNIVITQPTPLTITLIPTSVSCFSANDGAIQTTVTGGTSPYTFAWSNNASTQNISNLTAGTYTVTVTDFKGCIQTQNIVINQPNPLTATFSKINVSCNGGSDGSINLMPTGGTLPYSFDWSNGLGMVQNPQNIPAGNYRVTITDVNNCSKILLINITQPAALSAAVTTVNPTCGNTLNGAIQTTISGGTSPYTFAWSGGLAAVQNPQNIGGGNYTVTITDAKNCTTTAAANIVTPAAMTTTFNNIAASCFNTNDGTISMTVTNGVAPYSYAWSGGLAAVQNPQNASGGNYTVTITDANNCVFVANTIVNAPPAIVLNVVENQPACGLNGAITVNASGGNAPYNYTWNPAANTGNTNSANNLLGGNYWVTVTDASGCSQVSNVVNFASSSNLVVTSAIIHPKCQAQTGSIGITPTSGVAPFTYTWTANANAGNVNVVSQLAGGNYGVTVTDAFGCDTVLAYTLNPATILIGNATVTNVTCGQNNGSIVYNIISGTAPYTYAWSNTPNNSNTQNNLPQGDYDLVVTDGNNCSILETITVSGYDDLAIIDSVIQIGCEASGGIYLTISGGNAPYTYTWSTNANTGNSPNATSLLTGTYDITVTDADNCQATASYFVDEVAPFSVEMIEQIDNNCFQGEDGSITVNAIDTNNPVNYAWSNGQNGMTATNLAAGNYTVSITDIISNCQQTETFTITEPDEYIIDIGNDLLVEIGSTVMIQVNNPRADYVYTWEGSNGFTGTGVAISTVVNENTTFTVLGILDGCPPVRAVITVKVVASGTIEIPNAFSPNLDGKNDIFRIATALPIIVTEFKIFNRYGEIIYNNTQGEWDGKHQGLNAPNGAYIYLIQYLTPLGEEVTKKGEVILVR